MNINCSNDVTKDICLFKTIIPSFIIQDNYNEHDICRYSFHYKESLEKAITNKTVAVFKIKENENRKN